METTGAVLGGRDGWDETAAAGNRPYGGAWEGPIFVLTHHLDDAVPAEGVTFLDRDVAEAVRIGLEAAGGRRGQGLKPQTVLHVHRTLHKAFKDAVRRGKLGANPAAAVDPPRAEGTRPRGWTAAQLRAFLDGVRDHEFFAAWMLFATTGMGRGEMAGLAREDLDLERGHVRVKWTLGVVDGELTWKRRPKTKASSATGRPDRPPLPHRAARDIERLEEAVVRSAPLRRCRAHNHLDGIRTGLGSVAGGA